MNYDDPDRFSLAHRRRYRVVAAVLLLMAAVLAGMSVVELADPNPASIPLVLFCWLAFLAIATSAVISRRAHVKRHAAWLVAQTRRRDAVDLGEAFAIVFFNALCADLRERGADDETRDVVFDEIDEFLNHHTLSAARVTQIARAAAGTTLEDDVEAFLATLHDAADRA